MKKQAGTRTLSASFMADLKEGGILHGVLERVRNDETMMFAIRSGYANVYYRGGNLMKIVQDKEGYRFSFETNYKRDIALPAEHVADTQGTTEWIHALPNLKEAIDTHLSSNAKHEREFQQLVARENNYSAISNETEYFVVDIEFADSALGARFDMVALRWEARQRRSGTCKLAVIEMKYGDGSLDGGSGLQSHLDDIEQFLSRGNDSVKTFAAAVQEQFAQLRELGLVRFGPQGNELPVTVDCKGALEVILLLANHNPRSTKLRDVVQSLNVPPGIDLRFFVANFAGYGLHTDNLVPLSRFQEMLEAPGTPYPAGRSE
jgi:hypothetical protein